MSSLQVATASSEPSVPAMLTNKSILNVKPETGGSPEMLFAEATPVVTTLEFNVQTPSYFQIQPF